MPRLNLSELFLLDTIRANSETELGETFVGFLDKSNELDWPLIANIIPEVYLKAKNFHEGFKIPKETLNKFRQIYFWRVARNEQIKHEVVKLAKEFNKANIDLIFLKGVVLLNTVYDKDTDLRMVEDIDVLIKKDELWKAENVLKEIGYEIVETDKEREIFLKEHFHFKYLKKEIDLELHWDIGEQWHWDVVKSKELYRDLLFASAEKIMVKGIPIRVLRPVGNIFVACFHFDRGLFLYHRIIYSPFVYLSRHSGEREQLICHSLRFFYEIKKMLRYYENKVKWDDLFSLARAAKKEYEIFTLLFLSEKVTKAGIPKAVLKKMKKNIFVRLYIFLCRMIQNDSLVNLFFINRFIYRVMLICSYLSNRKIYLLMMRIVGGRV